MDWTHLIDAARLLAGATGTPARGRPRQIMLKRAVSSAYYAMFHALCVSNADTLIGTSPAADRMTWRRTYRALEHGPAKNRMEQQLANLPPVIQDFAKSFSVLQEQRHKSDYDPDAYLQRSFVIRLIDRAESAIRALFSADVGERRSLAALVLLRDR